MKRIVAPAVVLLAALTVGGCSAGMSGGDAAPDVGMPAAPQPAVGDGGSAGGGESGGEEPAEDRSILTTGTMTITAEDPVAAAAEAARLTEELGGRVDRRSEFAPQDGDTGGARLTLRIPADALPDAIEALRDLGEVEQVATTASDVTREVQDLDARIDALSASIDRLLALLATAEDTEALIQLETAIADRQAELESLQAHRRGLADAVAMSTLEVTLQSEDVAPVDRPETFLDGLLAGWKAMVAVGSTTLVVIGALVPWLALAGLVAALVVGIVRAAQRRSRRRAGGAASDGTAA